MDIEQLESQFAHLNKELSNIWDQVMDALAASKDECAAQVEMLKKENEELSKKYNEAQSKIDKIEHQLKDTLQQLESITKTKAKGIDAMQLLEVYLVLMENVFESQVHTRLLIILHGEKEQFTIDELTGATGLPPLQVKQGIFDLRNAGVVDYDDETQVVTLKMRFME